jgi:hypothetical protein
VIIPKLEYTFLDDIYIGAVLVVRKKNQFPIIYTDHSGAIIGMNKHATEVVAEKETHPHSLFSMFPRLFSFYFPQLTKDTTDPITLIRQSASSNKSTEQFDCLFFRMLASVPAQIEHLRKFSFLLNAEDTNQLSDVANHWLRVRQYIKYSKQYPSILQELSNTILDKLSLLSQKIDLLLQVSMKLEYHRYQFNLEIYEICISDAQTCSRGVKLFLSFSICTARKDLLSLMQLSPETVRSLRKRLI